MGFFFFFTSFFQKINVNGRNYAAQMPKMQLNFVKTLAPPLLAAIVALSPGFYSPGEYIYI